MSAHCKELCLLFAALMAAACGPEESMPVEPAVARAAGTVCTANFTRGAGTDLWQTPGNWDTGAVPGTSDNVCIGTGFNVTLSASVPAINSLGSDGTLTVSSTLSIAAASVVNNTLTLSGTLTGNGDLTVTSTLNWTGGTITGSGGLTIASGASLNLAPTAAHSLFRTTNNAGTATVSGQGLNLGFGAIFNNQLGATFDIQNDSGIGYAGGATPTFNNAGTFQKSGGSATSSIGITFNNTGSVAVQSGTLNLPVGTSTGSFSTAAGTTLGLSSQTLSGNIAGSGNVVLSGNTNVNGSVIAGANLTISGTVNFNSGANLSGITVASPISGTANFNAGTVLGPLATPLAITGTANFSTGNSITLPSPTNLSGTLSGTDDLAINGTLNWTAAPSPGPGA